MNHGNDLRLDMDYVETNFPVIARMCKKDVDAYLLDECPIPIELINIRFRFVRKCMEAMWLRGLRAGSVLGSINTKLNN